MATNLEKSKNIQLFLIKCEEEKQMLSMMRGAGGTKHFGLGNPVMGPSLEQLLKCLSCEKVFLDRPMPQGPEGALHHCSECLRKLTALTTPPRHFLDSSSSPPPPHGDSDLSDDAGSKPCKCNTCGKSFRYMSSLNRHLVVHSGEKRYSCEVCGKAFTQAAHLKTHSVSHTGEKPFQCPVCAMAFSRKGNLKRHLQVHKGMKFYECDACNKPGSASLRHHHHHHHHHD